jgi:putative transposase
LRRDKLEQDELGMRRGKKHSTEEILNLLRQGEVDLANSKILPQACKKGEIVELTYYCGQLKVHQARGLKELEQENAKLKRLVSELSLEKLVSKCFPTLQGWYVFRCIVTLICLAFAARTRAQSVQLVDAPKPSANLLAASTSVSDSSSTANLTGPSDLAFSLDIVQTSQSTPDANHGEPHPTPSPNVPLDANENPIQLNRQQPQRILGFMPNFRSVSGGATPHPPAGSITSRSPPTRLPTTLPSSFST